MKGIFVLVGGVILSGLAFADEVKPVAAEKPALSEAERAERRYRNTGGIVCKNSENPGMFAFVNAGTDVGFSVYSNVVQELEWIFRIRLVHMSAKERVSPSNVRDALKATKANAALFITDDPGNAEAILIAPESRWGILNLAALRLDAPAREVYEKRIRREVWRAFAMTAGSPHTEMEHCLLNPIFSARQLDDFDGNTIGPEPYLRIGKTLEKMGIRQYYRSTYKSACRQGWAPPPTNDVQKAIWDKVQAEKAAKAAAKKAAKGAK